MWPVCCGTDLRLVLEMADICDMYINRSNTYLDIVTLQSQWDTTTRIVRLILSQL
jgi:hypothetical protein